MYMVMSRDQNTRRSSITNDNSSTEMVEQLKYLGTTSMNQNSVQEEIKSRLISENAGYHSAQNLLFSNLQSKNIQIKIYRTVIFPVVFYGCKTWSRTLREKRRLRALRTR
jgi:hypothetical protein